MSADTKDVTKLVSTPLFDLGREEVLEFLNQIIRDGQIKLLSISDGTPKRQRVAVVYTQDKTTSILLLARNYKIGNQILRFQLAHVVGMPETNWDPLFVEIKMHGKVSSSVLKDFLRELEQRGLIAVRSIRSSAKEQALQLSFQTSMTFSFLYTAEKGYSFKGIPLSVQIEEDVLALPCLLKFNDGGFQDSPKKCYVNNSYIEYLNDAINLHLGNFNNNNNKMKVAALSTNNHQSTYPSNSDRHFEYNGKYTINNESDEDEDDVLSDLDDGELLDRNQGCYYDDTQHTFFSSAGNQFLSKFDHGFRNSSHQNIGKNEKMGQVNYHGGQDFSRYQYGQVSLNNDGLWSNNQMDHWQKGNSLNSKANPDSDVLLIQKREYNEKAGEEFMENTKNGSKNQDNLLPGMRLISKISPVCSDYQYINDNVMCIVEERYRNFIEIKDSLRYEKQSIKNRIQTRELRKAAKDSDANTLYNKSNIDVESEYSGEKIYADDLDEIDRDLGDFSENYHRKFNYTTKNNTYSMNNTYNKNPKRITPSIYETKNKKRFSRRDSSSDSNYGYKEKITESENISKNENMNFIGSHKTKNHHQDESSVLKDNSQTLSDPKGKNKIEDYPLVLEPKQNRSSFVNNENKDFERDFYGYTDSNRNKKEIKEKNTKYGPNFSHENVSRRQVNK